MYIKTFIFILIVLPALNCQGGGGGGGGGGCGGGGGGGEGGGGGYSGGSGWNSDSNYDNNQPTCSEICKDDQKCIEQCQQNNKTTSIIVGSIIGGIFGIIFTVVAIIFLKHQMASFFSYLRKKFVRNKANSEAISKSISRTISKEEYESKVKAIFELFDSAKQIKFVQKSLNYSSVIVTIQITTTKDFQSQIRMTGNDKFGQWRSQGKILCNNQGKIFIKWRKQYNDKEKAGQTGQWKFLMYETTNIEDRQINGKWYYVGFQNSLSYSGKWQIKLKQQLQSKEDIKTQKFLTQNVSL